MRSFCCTYPYFAGKSAENSFLCGWFFVISEKIKQMACNFSHYDVK